MRVTSSTASQTENVSACGNAERRPFFSSSLADVQLILKRQDNGQKTEATAFL